VNQVAFAGLSGMRGVTSGQQAAIAATRAPLQNRFGRLLDEQQAQRRKGGGPPMRELSISILRIVAGSCYLCRRENQRSPIFPITQAALGL
jgi:hypothetical protein